MKMRPNELLTVIEGAEDSKSNSSWSKIGSSHRIEGQVALNP